MKVTASAYPLSVIALAGFLLWAIGIIRIGQGVPPYIRWAVFSAIGLVFLYVRWRTRSTAEKR